MRETQPLIFPYVYELHAAHTSSPTTTAFFWLAISIISIYIFANIVPPAPSYSDDKFAN